MNSEHEEGEIRRRDNTLDSLAARARRSEAARQRRRRESIERRETESWSITGALTGSLDEKVVISFAGYSDTLGGVICAVGADLVEVLAGNTRWFVSIDAISSVLSVAGRVSGDVTQRADTELSEVLEDLADATVPVSLVMRTGHRLSGVVVAVGEAVVVRDEIGSSAVVGLSQLSAVALRSPT